MLRRCFVLLACTVMALAVPAWARGDGTPDAALEALLGEARAVPKPDCTQPGTDRLVRAMCNGKLRIGVREYYPLFGTGKGDEREGYDVDVGRAIAKRLGVEPEFVRVNAATRIPLVSDDRIDLIIATMGHNTQRDGQVRFIRPHYYQSETILVGPRNLAIADWDDLTGRTVCVSVGNGSNAELVAKNVRLMLFDEPGVLPDRLLDETCSLAAQDNSFFDFYFTNPAFAERFHPKFGFAQVPWGLGVAREGSDKLARALELMSQIFHRDGAFLEIARANRVGTAFLQGQRAVWSRPDCNTDTGSTNPACILPPLKADLQPTSFAGGVTRFERWLDDRTDISIALPMFKTVPAWSLFKEGVVNSLILITGALLATLLVAVLFGAALGARAWPLRWMARAVTITLQSSPIVLTLVISAALAHAFFPYSAAMVLGAAIAALGLTNGGNAGQAISEAMNTLRREQPGRYEGGELLLHGFRRSASQVVAFLVNAAKGTPIASFIGAPELLSALTDITSFSSGRATTYTLLLIFYTVIVMVVVWLCGRFRLYLERREAMA